MLPAAVARRIPQTFELVMKKPAGRSIQCHWEIVFGVVEADVLDHFAEQVQIVGQQPGFDIIAEHIAENPAEIFVPWIR